MKIKVLLLMLCTSASIASSVMFRHDTTIQTDRGTFVDLAEHAKKQINVERVPQVVITIKDDCAKIPQDFMNTHKPCYLKYVSTQPEHKTIELLIQAEKLDRATHQLLTQHGPLADKKAIRIYRNMANTSTSAAQWVPVLTLPEQDQTILADISIYPDGTLHL